MSELKIITNNKPRYILYWYELKPREKKEFTYLDTEDRQDAARFFRYRGNVYDLEEFFTTREVATMDLTGWEGYQSDSFFSGIVVKYCDDYERIIAGRYFS